MKALIVFGTRPEIIKLAPLYFTLKKDIDVRTLHTRQHDELADDVLEFFKLKPEFSERCMLIMNEERRSGSIGTIIRAINPDVVIVQGDTFTTYAGAYTAFLLKKPVIHMEAGLRTYKKFSPYPEETFRRLTTQLSDFHFAPTQINYDNLIAEGVKEDRIFVAGNTIVDSMNMTSKLIKKDDVNKELMKSDSELPDMIKGKQFIVITSHRRENIGKRLERICRASIELATKYPEKIFIWTMHKNPAVREIVIHHMANRPNNLRLIESISYPTMLYLIKHSQMMLTDSGGIQEEVVSYNKPIIILREDPERPEVVTEGLGFLVGSDTKKIISTFEKLDRNYESFKELKNPYGDGRTSERVLKLLLNKEVIKFLKHYPENSEKVFNIKELL